MSDIPEFGVYKGMMTSHEESLKMSNTTVPTHEMIKNLADYIVNGMSFQELTQFVYDDVYSIMLEDNDIFYANLEQLGYEPEDFTNEKFRGEDDN